MKYAVLLVFLLCSYAVYGQDLIVTTTGDSLKCKIIEVGDDEIQFRFGKSGNIISINKSEMILYKYNFEPVPGKTPTTNKRIVRHQAQPTESNTQARFTFGLRAGFNLSNVYGNINNNPYTTLEDTKMKPGFQIGMVGDYSWNDAFSIQPGILFATQGYKRYENTYNSALTVILELYYLQIPVNAQYKLDLGKTKLLLQAGPYLGFVAFGQYKFQYDYGNYYTNVSESDWDLKRFDFGIGLGAGLQFGKIQAGLGYNIGLANISKDDSMKNNGWVFTLTYMFGK